MIGIDLTFVHPQEIKKNKIYRSFSIFVADLLDAFVKLNLQDNFCLLVNNYALSFMKTRFSDYKINPIAWVPSDIIYYISSGKKAATNSAKTFRAYHRSLKNKDVDLIWYPYGLPENIGEYSIPYICTIHDLIIYHAKKDKKTYSRYAKMINNSKKIVTVTNFIKSDLLKSFNYPENEIYVIPNPIQPFPNSVRKPESICNNFILDINGFGEHKNTLTLLKAYNLIKNKCGLDLCLCGGWKDDAYINTINNYIKTNNLTDKVHLFFAIPEEEKNWLLKNASLFVTPSTNEGFGRTPVEAATLEIPVISTKEASLYEVTKGLVHYYENARDPNELASSILQVISNPDSSNKLHEIAESLRNDYSPISCAEKYWSVFNTSL